jgi:hypothetical protein
MKNIKWLYILIASVFIFSCKSSEKSINTTSAYLNFETQFVKQESFGTDCYKIYVSGDSKKECIKKAKLELIKSILFTGVHTAPNPKPLVPEVNAIEKYSGFFNSFLRESGQFSEFVSLHKGGKIDENDRMKTGERKLMGVELLVNTIKLKDYLESVGVIKKQF